MQQFHISTELGNYYFSSSNIMVPYSYSVFLAPEAKWKISIFFTVLGLELRAYTLSLSTSPFLRWVFLR
jgi:hypothetical protein